MKQYAPLLILCLVLVQGNLACAPKQPPVLSETGYAISLHTAPDTIWLHTVPSTRPDNYFGFGEIVIHVQDAQGQPADGVPVEFQLEPPSAQIASVWPKQALTQHGKARAIIEPRTTGVVHVMVRVENVVQEARFFVGNQVGSATPMHERGLPYPRPY